MGGLIQYLSRIYTTNEWAKSIVPACILFRNQGPGWREWRGSAVGLGVLGYAPPTPPPHPRALKVPEQTHHLQGR